MMQNTSEPLKLSDYWSIVCRRRRSMFVAFFAVWLLACLLAWLLPPRYRSETTVLIQGPQIPQHYVLPNVVSDVQAYLQTLTQQVLSRPRLQRIVDDLQLYSSSLDRFLAGRDVIEKMRQDIKIDLLPTKPASPQSSDLASFTITYSGSNPQMVQEVTSRLSALFIDENQRTRQQESENTTAFLESQLHEARTHLEDQGEKIKEFKARFIGRLPGELQSNIGILGALQGRLQQANEALDRSEQEKLYLTSLLSAYRETPSLASAGATEKLDPDVELARLRVELTEAESRYTNEHPTVLELRDEIAKTEELKAQLKKGDEAVSRPMAEIQSQLKGTELDIHNREKEIAAVQSEMQIYESRLNETPVREQQLADLSGDYEQQRTNYDLLVKKRDDSALATNLEKHQQGEQFSVLDPPSYPAKPYFPNRLLFTIAGVALGLAAAIGTAFMRETLDDRIHADREISTVCKVPMLVAIPSLTTASEIAASHWRAKKEVACATVTVIAITASALLAFYHG
jgi:polysaccharide chain length determinant protein (PEP-CTERM system associated)